VIFSFSEWEKPEPGTGRTPRQQMESDSGDNVWKIMNKRIQYPK
jgi:hypothetical protein